VRYLKLVAWKSRPWDRDDLKPKYSMPDWEDLTEEQLVQKSREGQGGGAIFELTRRLKHTLEHLNDNLSSLKESVERGQNATNRLTGWLIVLTAVILLLTAVMAAPLIHKIFNFYFST